MTLANKISVGRLVLMPVFLVEMIYYVQTGNAAHWLASILLFAVAAISDGVDGYIARRYNQKSELGAFLDPLADKFLLVFSLVFLSLDNSPYFDRLPLWLIGTVFTRDFMILIGVFVIYYTTGKVNVKPHFTGKVATVLQIATISWTLLKWPAAVMFWLALAAAIFTGISFGIYLRAAIHQLSGHPISSATPPKS